LFLMLLVRRDRSSSSQPRDLSFRVFPYKNPILIAHLELETLVLDGVNEEKQLQLKPAQGLVVQDLSVQRSNIDS
jgi:hypothetical protein